MTKGHSREDNEQRLMRHPLDERKRKILRAVIDDYVSSCEPVGSKALLQRHALGVSSATIRNEMAELEDLGYLEQPHTSAGRIPSDLGYRAYVDDILKVAELPEGEREEIRRSINHEVTELQTLIKSAADTLAERTDFTSLVLTPTYGETTLRQVKILMIEPGKALVVVVLSAGVVRDRLIHIPDVLDAGQLMDIAGAVEDALAGRKLQDITLVTVTDAGQGREIPEPLLNQVLFETYLSIKQAENIDVYMNGPHRLLKQPEFSEVGKAHRFLDTLSQNGLVAGYLSELPENEGGGQGNLPAYSVRIGQEIALDGMEDCSFISTSYRLGDSVRGKIAVVGPKRMLYSKIISDVSFVNQTLNTLIKRLNGGSTEGEAHEK